MATRLILMNVDEQRFVAEQIYARLWPELDPESDPDDARLKAIVEKKLTEDGGTIPDEPGDY